MWRLASWRSSRWSRRSTWRSQEFKQWLGPDQDQSWHFFQALPQPWSSGCSNSWQLGTSPQSNHWCRPPWWQPPPSWWSYSLISSKIKVSILWTVLSIFFFIDFLILLDLFARYNSDIRWLGPRIRFTNNLLNSSSISVLIELLYFL